MFRLIGIIVLLAKPSLRSMAKMYTLVRGILTSAALNTGEWMANGRSLPAENKQADLRICESIVAYLEFAGSYYADNGNPGKEYVCMCDATKSLGALYSRTKVTGFGPLALKAILQKWIDRGLCRTHINQRINRIRRIFKWGVD